MWLTVIGRLKPHQTLAAARANLRALQTVIREEADPAHKYLNSFFARFVFGAESGRAGRSLLRSSYERPLFVLELLVVLLLVLCCANTALLISAQTAARTREFALRSALGASRPRMLRQAFLEIVFSPQYFSVAGTRILEGRAFHASDGNDSGVCILSRAAASAFFPHGSAVSQPLYSRAEHTDKPSDKPESLAVSWEWPRTRVSAPCANRHRPPFTSCFRQTIWDRALRVLGSAAATATNRALRSLVYGTEAGSLLPYLESIAVIVAVVLLTMIVPARKATSIDPIRALRVE
jgi:hypothetical protein